MELLKTRMGRFLDYCACRIDFRRGIYGAMLVLLALWFLTQAGSFYLHQGVRQHNAMMQDQLMIGKKSQEMRDHLTHWFRLVIPPVTKQSGKNREQEIARESSAFFELVQQELAWCSDQEDLAYMSQLQQIVELYERLLQLQKGYTGLPTQMIDMASDFDALQQLVSGLEQKQLSRIIEDQEKRSAVSEASFLVANIDVTLIVLLLAALLLLLYRSIYLKLQQSMDVLRSWVAGSFLRRVTDVRLLDKVVDCDDPTSISRYPFSAMAHDINELGDVFQVFLVETSASLEAMAAGNTDRRIDVDGFPWSLRKVALDINANIDRVVDIYMKADQEQESLDEFQRDLGIISQSLGAVADSMGMHGMELLDASQLMESKVQTSEQEAVRVEKSMGEASHAVEDISASISEVAGQVREASQITSEAVEQAQETRTTISQLEAASTKIGDMVDLITSIARQTQMLSMNATIEAARAGEAGKGFAVVANEVKALATQTSNAAQDISASIEEIQSSTGFAMQVIQKVAETIERINGITVDIERSTAQQEDAAKGISHNVAQANRATTVMGENLQEVRAASDTTHSNVETMNTATQDLRQSIDELDSVVKNYIGEAESDDIELF